MIYHAWSSQITIQLEEVVGLLSMKQRSVLAYGISGAAFPVLF